MDGVNLNILLDVKARSFFRDGQTAFFDVRIANVNAESNKDLPTEAMLRKAENEKKRVYNQRVIESEQGTFTPLASELMVQWRKNVKFFTSSWQRNFH